MANATAASAGGVELRWDACAADGGLSHREFACDTSTTTGFQLVGSFRLDADLSRMSGAEMVVDIQASSETLPAWWRFREPGACRQRALSISASDGEHCADWAVGQGSVNIAGYKLGFHGPATARLLGISAVPISALADLSAGVEYLVMRLKLDARGTIGSAACDGCNVPVCIVFTSLNLTTSGNVDNRLLTHAASEGGQWVHWQQAPAPGVDCPGAMPKRSAVSGVARDSTR